MTLEEALDLVESTLEANRGKHLSTPEKIILKAAWENETYSTVAESLYISVGHIKDVASLLWQSLSELLGEKVTKNNFRHLLLHQQITPTLTPPESAASDTFQNENAKGTILIIDDLLENLQVLTKILTKQGYKVRSFSNGNLALKSINIYPPEYYFT